MVKDFGKWVHCTSYLKSIKDGRFLHMDKDIQGRITGVSYVGDGDDIPEVCECEGALEFLKTYYEKRHTEFDGVLVGTKKIVVDGYLYGDIDYEPCYGDERIVVGKQAKTTVLCGIVFFGNNQKRFVPMEDLEVIPEDLPSIDFLRTVLTKYFNIGDSDCYLLTRNKIAFALPEDFVEFDEESVENILNYIQEEWQKNE